MAKPDLADLCREVRAKMKDVIQNDEEDMVAWKAAAALTDSGLLVGKSRGDIEMLLGPGTPCGKYTYGDSYTFQSFGFARDDIYYEVGQLPKICVGGVPNIVIGFGKDGRCDKVKMIHTQ